MGRISKKLACGPSASLSQTHESGTSRAHPYLQLSHAHAVAEPIQTLSVGQDRIDATINTTSSGTSLNTTNTAKIEETRRTENPGKEELRLVGTGINGDSISSCKNYMDDSWSPFDAPDVQQCLETQPQSLLSLLERKEHTPIYRPSQQNAFGQQMAGPRNPALFYRTYAGYTQAPESITLSIIDGETGEYLCQFPSR
ncbi:hypothetical protein IW140_004741 [Coemansia sp. RSA 1813]|nr:hypothetical protein EV178_004800 [Coemansia sp. RSA 1646]KAJ1771051.1 hypothetical protein LPJ74_002638 [Coemansia sp. RSA 1843]KAJ2087596.1 hypothetical protein IW138_004879 [Coemansia sp. RSA 986]KAJ2566878.1 hypothetical protein IW140_004741 [Coemansia sp. RSA 1813]